MRKEMYEIYLTYSEVVGSQEGDDFYIQHNSFSPENVHRSNEGIHWFETVPVNFDPKTVDMVYLVYVIYSTGSTFGRTEGAWSVVGAYPTIEEAAKIKKSIYDGTYKGYKAWEGYFERLTYVETEIMHF